MTAVDTNILVYIFDDRDAVKQRAAAELCDSLADAILLWQVAVEFIATIRKIDPSPDSQSRAWKRLDALRSRLPLALPSSNVLTIAQGLTTSHQVQFWDAMIYAACLGAGVTTLYSEDVPGESIPGLVVVNPFAGGSR